MRAKYVMPRSRRRKLTKRPHRAPSQDWIDEGLGLINRKLSGHILELIKPYQAAVEDDHAALSRLVLVGVSAWNLALLPEDRRDGALDELARRALEPEKASRPSRISDALGRVLWRRAKGSKSSVSKELCKRSSRSCRRQIFKQDREMNVRRPPFPDWHRQSGVDAL
jgi:hypothetical protein